MNEVLNRINKDHVFTEGDCSCGWSQWAEPNLSHGDHKILESFQIGRVDVLGQILQFMGSIVQPENAEEVEANVPSLPEPSWLGAVVEHTFHDFEDNKEYAVQYSPGRWIDSNGVTYTWAELSPKVIRVLGQDERV